MKKTYVQLGGAILLLIITIVAYAIWYGGIRAKSDEVASIEAQIADKSQATTRIAQAKAQLASLASEEESVNQYFISTNDIVTFLEQLATTGKYLGANVQVVSVSASSGTSHGVLNLSLTITGPFDAVMRTLGSIEYGPYDVRTTSVTLSQSSSFGSTPTWEAVGQFMVGMQSGTQPLPTVSQQPAAPAVASTSIPSVPTTSGPSLTI